MARHASLMRPYMIRPQFMLKYVDAHRIRCQQPLTTGKVYRPARYCIVGVFERDLGIPLDSGPSSGSTISLPGRLTILRYCTNFSMAQAAAVVLNGRLDWTE